MTTLNALLFSHAGQYYIIPLSTIESVLPNALDTTVSDIEVNAPDKLTQIMFYQHKWVPIAYLTDVAIKTGYSNTLLINANIANAVKTVAVRIDAPPKLLKLSEQDIVWEDPDKALTKITVNQVDTMAYILDNASLERNI